MPLLYLYIPTAGSIETILKVAVMVAVAVWY